LPKEVDQIFDFWIFAKGARMSSGSVSDEAAEASRSEATVNKKRDRLVDDGKGKEEEEEEEEGEEEEDGVGEQEEAEEGNGEHGGHEENKGGHEENDVMAEEGEGGEAMVVEEGEEMVEEMVEEGQEMGKEEKQKCVTYVFEKEDTVISRVKDGIFSGKKSSLLSFGFVKERSAVSVGFPNGSTLHVMAFFTDDKLASLKDGLSEIMEEMATRERPQVNVGKKHGGPARRMRDVFLCSMKLGQHTLSPREDVPLAISEILAVVNVQCKTNFNQVMATVVKDAKDDVSVKMRKDVREGSRMAVLFLGKGQRFLQIHTVVATSKRKKKKSKKDVEEESDADNLQKKTKKEKPVLLTSLHTLSGLLILSDENVFHPEMGLTFTIPKLGKKAIMQEPSPLLALWFYECMGGHVRKDATKSNQQQGKGDHAALAAELHELTIVHKGQGSKQLQTVFARAQQACNTSFRSKSAENVDSFRVAINACRVVIAATVQNKASGPTAALNSPLIAPFKRNDHFVTPNDLMEVHMLIFDKACPVEKLNGLTHDGILKQMEEYCSSAIEDTEHFREEDELQAIRQLRLRLQNAQYAFTQPLSVKVKDARIEKMLLAQKDLAALRTYYEKKGAVRAETIQSLEDELRKLILAVGGQRLNGNILVGVGLAENLSQTVMRDAVRVLAPITDRFIKSQSGTKEGYANHSAERVSNLVTLLVKFVVRVGKCKEPDAAALQCLRLACTFSMEICVKPLLSVLESIMHESLEEELF
jgi:hypothetical protein